MPRGRKIPTTVPGFGHIERRAGTSNWYLVYAPSPGARRIVRAARTPDQQAAYDQLVDLAGKYARGEMSHCGSPAQCTFAHLFSLLEADYRKRGLHTTDDMVARVNKHLRPWFGSMRVIELRKRDVQAFIDSRLNGYRTPGGETERLEPGTVNKLLALLKRALALGTQEDPPLVVRIPNWFARVPGERVRSGIVTPDQYRSIRDLLPPHARLAFIIAYHTGMRRGAILSLRWDWVDWREGVIVIPPDPDASTKRKPREVPIYGEMRAYLEMAQSEAKTGWIVEFEGSSVRDIKTAWRTACTLAGVPDALFHDLRRTAVTNMEAAGIPRHVAMGITGHRTQAVYERYGIAQRKSTQAAAREMERWLQSAETASANPAKPN